MKTIEVDDDVYKELGKRAIPFKETTPNAVLRRMLGLRQVERTKGTDASDKLDDRAITDNDIIEQKMVKESQFQGKPAVKMVPRNNLSFAKPTIQPAFLTFLFDKYCNTKGNFTTADILPFMEKFRLMTPTRTYYNPWMKGPYKNINSCKSTIEHFRQCRQFGCWGYQDSKHNCSVLECPYHPQTDEDQIQRDKCDLSKGVVWKRSGPKGMFSYGEHYVKVILDQLLGGRSIPVQEVFHIFYPQFDFGQLLIERFKNEFHFKTEEMTLFIL